MFASEKQARLLEQQRVQVEQLRREAAVTRTKGNLLFVTLKTWIFDLMLLKPKCV